MIRASYSAVLLVQEKENLYDFGVQSPCVVMKRTPTLNPCCVYDLFKYTFQWFATFKLKMDSFGNSNTNGFSAYIGALTNSSKITYPLMAFYSTYSMSHSIKTMTHLAISLVNIALESKYFRGSILVVSFI